MCAMSAEHHTHPLPPVIDDASRVLILGSFPSPKSRELGFYYANPQNRFWTTLARVWGEPVPWGASPAEMNGARLSFCHAHHIALWDVLASCTIEGASDATIKDPVPNDIASLVKGSAITHIFCTGTVAAKLFETHIAPELGMECVRLPSTSPANAAWKLEKLVEAYREIRVVVETGALSPVPEEKPEPKATGKRKPGDKKSNRKKGSSDRRKS